MHRTNSHRYEDGIRKGHDGLQSNSTFQDTDAKMAQYLALHLVCNTHFREAMSNNTAMVQKTITLQRSWLSSIQSPPDYADTLDASFEKQDFMNRVLFLAKEIYYEVHTLNWDKITAPPSSYTQKWNRLREDLFRNIELRAQVLTVMKRAEEQLLLAKGPQRKGIRQDFAQNHNFHLYEQAAAECRSYLASTALEDKIIANIDELLLGFVERDEQEYSFTGKRSKQSRELDELSSDRVKERYNFVPQYKAEKLIAPWETPQTKSKKNALHSNLDSGSEFPAKPLPVIDTIASNGSLADHDARLTESVPFVMSEIDPQRFRAILQGLLNTKTRLPFFQNIQRKTPSRPNVRPVQRKKEDFHFAGRMSRADILHDNIVHAHGFFEKLQKKAAGCCNSEDVERIFRRLMAIVAICFGGTSEPAFFVTTMDRLLNAMSDQFGERFFIGDVYLLLLCWKITNILLAMLIIARRCSQSLHCSSAAVLLGLLSTHGILVPRRNKILYTK